MRRWALTFTLLACMGASASADDRQKILSLDHYVIAPSTVTAIAGQPTPLYLRERVKTATLAEPGGPRKVVLFVHGAGTPAEVSFDVPYQDYSWMAYLADAGYDVFAVDMTGYGRSARPAAMHDPCNLPAEQKTRFGAAADCKPSHAGPLTSLRSDWDDISAAVAYVRALRKVDKVSLVAWSLGGPRAGGWAAQNPDKVERLVLLSPAYARAGAPTPPPAGTGAAFNTQNHAEFIANWDRQAPCTNQYDAGAAASVWSEMLKSDPLGAAWSGVRRAPLVANAGWTRAMVGAMTTPTLMVAGIHDAQVVPQRVRDLHTDLGSRQKVMIDLGCSSHNAMWERNHLLLFKASLEWLEKGTVNGRSEGVVRMGYPQ